MPILKKKMTLRLGRNTSLCIDLETGVTGLEGVARGLGSRLGRVPALTRATARLPGGAVRVPSARRKPARRERGNTPVFFVTGVGKSGTSWLMRMLDSHPEILCQGERRRQAPRQPDPPRNRALPRGTTARDKQEAGRRQVAAAQPGFHPGGQQDLPRGQSYPHHKRR